MLGLIFPQLGTAQAMKFSDLVQQLSSVIKHSSLEGQSAADVELTGVAAIADAQSGQVSYIEGEKYAHYLETTAASALILPVDADLQARANGRQIPWVAAADPRLVFAHAIALFYHPFQPAPAIHPSAVIDPSVTVGDQVHIGAHVVVQPGVTIGNQVCIHPNVTIYPDAVIGDRSVLHANCVIQERSQIGAD
ncbi:MAG: LpxD N-terminal domain-containing protein, partial [Cyanobacteria bacterium P01_H01_bin.119]